MKTLKLIRNIVLIVFFAIAIILGVLALSGFTIQPCLPAVNYPGEDGNLAIISSGGVTIASIPILGYLVYYIMTVPGAIIAGLIVLSLLATFIPFKKKEKDENTKKAEELSDTAQENLPALEDTENSQAKEPVTSDAAENITKDFSAAEITEAAEPVEPVVLDAEDLVKTEDPVVDETVNEETASENNSDAPAEDPTAKLEELLAENTDQKQRLEAKEAECAGLKKDLEKMKRAAAALDGKATELAEMLQKALDINAENEQENAVMSNQIKDLQESLNKGNEQYKSLYDRYAAVLDYLQGKDLASPEACEREKKTFAR